MIEISQHLPVSPKVPNGDFSDDEVLFSIYAGELEEGVALCIVSSY